MVCSLVKSCLEKGLGFIGGIFGNVTCMAYGLNFVRYGLPFLTFFHLAVIN